MEIKNGEEMRRKENESDRMYGEPVFIRNSVMFRYSSA